MITLSQAPVAKTEMLIRKPASEVFEAFIDPSITSQFWFTGGSGRLEAGNSVSWEWGMYGFSVTANVLEIEKDKRIVVEWGDPDNYTLIEWKFVPRGEDQTYVTITNSGFKGEGDAVVAQSIDSTEGFAMVLCGLKAFLEHGVRLNLVADKHPDAHVNASHG
jgi:Uncharacterized conserved protein